MNTSETWLCLHLPQLPVEVFCRGENLQDKPVVVLARQRVAHMNHAARKIGIQRGSSMNTAYTISEQVVSLEQDETKELATLAHLAQWAYQFTPNVAVKPPHSLLLDVTGCLTLFKGITNLTDTIVDKLAGLGFEATAGVGQTPTAALLTAESGNCFPDIKSIPTRFMRIDSKIIEGLEQMGISNIGGVLKLPMDGLTRRYGVFFTDYLQRLTGENPDPQKFAGNKPRFRSDITFLADVTNLDSLVFPIKRLLGELQDFLRGRQLMVNQFHLNLSHRNHGARGFNVFLANPDNDAQMFLMLSQLQLEKIDDMPEVDNVCLTASTFFESENHSGDLFQGTRFRKKDGTAHSKGGEARAARLINMFHARLGQNACFGLSLANDHRPELAFKTVNIARPDYWREEASDERNARPVLLLPSPRELNTRDDVPCISGPLEFMQGPERIDFGWWDSGGSSRDYYVMRHKCGALYWVFKDINQETWHLHGIFS